jgi:hypothetical protein
VLKPTHSLFTKKSVIGTMLKMVEMDENVTLAAQLEESCKHENFKAKSTVLFFYERNKPSR